MSKFSNVSVFQDITLVVASGNECRFEILGPGGLQVIFKYKPSQEDMDEAQAFILKTLEAAQGATTAYICPGGSKDIKDQKAIEDTFENYRKFLKDKN